MTSSILVPLIVAIFPAGAIAAAVMDATSFTIPNRLTLAIAAAFFPVALIIGLPVATIGACAAVGVLALVVGIGMFAMNWCGGGDAKLMAACALWLGLPAILPFLFATSVIGGLLALGLILARKLMPSAFVAVGRAWLGRLLLSVLGRLPQSAPGRLIQSVIGGARALGMTLARKTKLGALAPGGPAWLGRLLQPQEALPYGVAIALGAVIAFPSSPVFAALGVH